MHQYVTPTLIPHSVLRGNPLPDRVESKFVNTSRFKNLLLGHDNPSKVSFVLHGLEHGFDLGFRGTINDTSPPNNTSATAHKSKVTEAIGKELERGHTAGPFRSPPFPINHISPIGAVEKSDGSVRLIMDLSQPKERSVNDFIFKEDFPTEYVHFDVATHLVRQLGRGCLLSKIDIKHAFRLLPVRPEDWPLLVYCWEGLFFVDLKLPFGGRSSPSIFTDFADLLCWVLTTEYKLLAIHYADDYLLFSIASITHAEEDLKLFKFVFEYLNIPIAWDKLLGPATAIIYLGIQIDTDRFLVSIPEGKMAEMLLLLYPNGATGGHVKRRSCCP